MTYKYRQRNEATTITVQIRTGILITLLLSSFMTAMSTTVTANMIPAISVHFNTSSVIVQWLTSGATLVSGIMIPITAFLIKRIPNKKYFITAMTIFALGSFLAFCSSTFTMLLISRLIQAVGCGMMMSFAQIILLAIYPKERHGTIMASYSVAATLSSIVGPTYAGIILDAFGWKSVFLSLFIIAIILILCGFIFMQNITDKDNPSLNIGYVCLSSLGFSSLLIGIGNIGSASLYTLQSGGLILLGLMLLTVFSVLQLKSDRPMLNLRVLRYTPLCFSIILSVCMYFICMGSAMILPLFSQTIRNYSATTYGLATIVGAVMSAIATLCSGKIFDKIGIKPMFVICAVLFILYTILGLNFRENTGILYIGTAFAAQTIAMGTLNSPVTTIALSGLKGQERVDGSAIFNTFRQISSSLASTLAILIYTLIEKSHGSMSAIHGVYIYFGIVTIALIIFIILFLLYIRKNMK